MQLTSHHVIGNLSRCSFTYQVLANFEQTFLQSRHMSSTSLSRDLYARRRILGGIKHYLSYSMCDYHQSSNQKSQKKSLRPPQNLASRSNGHCFDFALLLFIIRLTATDFIRKYLPISFPPYEHRLIDFSLFFFVRSDLAGVVRSRTCLFSCCHN